ncbi:MAG: hypothetical protein FWF73_06010 [Spirochaetes bacterium]|nr:hypothetical protein [Spirochaetota bacterium]
MKNKNHKTITLSLLILGVIFAIIAASSPLDSKKNGYQTLEIRNPKDLINYE